MNRRSLGFAVLILAYVMLIPGLTQPMLQVKGAVKNSGIKKIASQYIADNKDIPGMFKGVAQDLIKRMGEEGEVEVYAKTQTILGTIKQLANAGYWLVAILIGLFSVVVPVTKGIMIVLANTSAQGERRALFGQWLMYLWWQ